MPPLIQGRARSGAVAIPPARAGCNPGHRGAEQGRDTGNKGDQHCAATRAVNVVLGFARDIVDSPLGIGLGESGAGADQAYEEGAIIILQSAMACCRQATSAFPVRAEWTTS